MIEATEIWEVFARQDNGIPLRHVGRVDAANYNDAVVFASTLYQEWKWADMYIVSRRAVRQVVRPA
jgi:1,2-phenylacetyl-CoA epoxidase PaaB subunit